MVETKRISSKDEAQLELDSAYALCLHQELNGKGTEIYQKLDVKKRKLDTCASANPNAIEVTKEQNKDRKETAINPQYCESPTVLIGTRLLLSDPESDTESSTCLDDRKPEAKSKLSDEALAKSIQKEEENFIRDKNSKEEEKKMRGTNVGKAVLAVEHIVKCIEQQKQQYCARVNVSNKNLLILSLQAVATDDMVFLAERLLDRQQDFDFEGFSQHIDLGYHYTNEYNMSLIRTNGLMTKKERCESGINSGCRGLVFGDGIYTANHPDSFEKFGEVGLLVARLQGNAIRVPGHLGQDDGTKLKKVTTVIGDKTAMCSRGGQNWLENNMLPIWPFSDHKHEIVLRNSSQCLPLVRYDKKILQNSECREYIRHIEENLRPIIDELFNGNGQKKPVSIINVPFINPPPIPDPQQRLPLPSSFHASNNSYPRPASNSNTASLPNPFSSGWVGVVPNQTSLATSNPPSSIWSQQSNPPTSSWSKPTWGTPAPPKSTAAQIGPLPNPPLSQELIYNAPETLVNGIPADALIVKTPQQDEKVKHLASNCSICRDALLQNNAAVATLSICKHSFHHNCIKQALKVKPQCPICRKAVGKPQGKSPSGRMNITYGHHQCSGHNCSSSIVIHYNMCHGIQKSYHDSPGKQHAGKVAIAYLPDDNEGRNLLRRLKYAFMHGLTFTIGVSMTTGRADQCTWASIHHKTSVSGGAKYHGYPDQSYFLNCNDELDSLNVPVGYLLNEDGSMK